MEDLLQFSMPSSSLEIDCSCWLLVMCVRHVHISRWLLTSSQPTQGKGACLFVSENTQYTKNHSNVSLRRARQEDKQLTCPLTTPFFFFLFPFFFLFGNTGRGPVLFPEGEYVWHLDLPDGDWSLLLLLLLLLVLVLLLTNILSFFVASAFKLAKNTRGLVVNKRISSGISLGLAYGTFLTINCGFFSSCVSHMLFKTSAVAYSRMCHILIAFLHGR